MNPGHEVRDLKATLGRATRDWTDRYSRFPMRRSKHLSPAQLRAAFRNGALRGPTAGLAHGFAQANLVVVPGDWATEFRQFCDRNPKPCPMLDVTGLGSPYPRRLAPEADLRTDLPGYLVFRDGHCKEVLNLSSEWRDDCVAFLLGCSFSFERALMAAGVPVRHIEVRRNVPMYITALRCEPAGRLAGPVVVSMRPIPSRLLSLTMTICSDYPGAHGEPVHAGDPAAIGIPDLEKPDFGDPVPVHESEVPVFWACGVTPQVVLRRSGCSWFATHKPGHMFISDREEDVEPLGS